MHVKALIHIEPVPPMGIPESTPSCTLTTHCGHLQHNFFPWKHVALSVVPHAQKGLFSGLNVYVWRLSFCFNIRGQQ